MANKKTIKRKRRQKVKSHIDTFRGPGEYAKAIIKCLQLVTSCTGNRPSIVFDDFLEITEATLEALPDQLKAVAQTGQFAPDTPQAAEVFARVRSRYEHSCHSPDTFKRIWEDGFCRAFALLLESAAPGLWIYANHDHGSISGPDVLGATYTNWANLDPSWQAQFFTPYNVALLMAKMTIMNGERDVHDRLKAALTHPDNILGAAVLLAGLAIPEDEPDLYRDWFFNRMIPAAIESGHFEPILFNEPAIGSGIMMLAAATQYPPWAVKYGLVRFTGQDVDRACYMMAKINSQIYGLNTYALKLEVAAAEAFEVRQQRTDGQPHATCLSPAQAIQTLYQGEARPSTADELDPSFEKMFRAVAVKEPA